MFAIILFAVLSCAAAAPQFHRNHRHGFGLHPPPFPHRDEFDFGDFGMREHFRENQYFHDNIFDTKKFWTELSREMSMFDQILNDFTKRFPSSVSSEGIDTTTNEYKVTIALAGFEKKDIVVKAREGLLMVQAINNKDTAEQRCYMDVRTLPDSVNVNGSWTFENGILKVVFPLLTKTEEVETTTEITTQMPEQLKPESREDVDNQSNNNQDADVGIGRGDLGKEKELEPTDEIYNRQSVEATTYAVDLKNEIEFVPVHY